MNDLPSWADRYFAITQQVGVQFNVTFIGDDARKAQRVLWDSEFSYYSVGRGDRPSMRRLYFRPDGDSIGDQAYDLTHLLQKVEEHDINIHNFQWTLMRADTSIKMVCARKGEGFEKWGFGRPNPRDPSFVPHQLLAGPLIDFLPGDAPEMFDWEGFEPVYLKVKTGNETHRTYVLSSHWLTDEQPLVVFRVTELTDAGVPDPIRQIEL